MSMSLISTIDDLDDFENNNERGRERCAKRRRDSHLTANGDATKRDKKRRKEQERRKEESNDSHEICPLYPDYHDHEGHFKYVLGESVGEALDEKEPSRRRYKLLDKVGQGTFGRVFTCWDRVERCYVAVKIVKAMKKYTHSAKFEIDILKKIHSPDTPKEPLEQDALLPLQHCINLLDSFLFKGHMCMVFPHCGLSLYDFMKRNDFKPFEMQVIKDIARYLFEALYYLHDKLNIIHTDLKPENVLFKSSETRKEQCDVDTDRDSRSQDSPTRSRSRSASSRTSRRSKSRNRQYYVPRSTNIKVIDLGSAIFESDHHSSIISTRHYRAPEVVLHLGWSFPADIWSVGVYSF